MEILGHGIDLMPIDVVRSLLAKSDDFVDGWFTNREQDDLRKRSMRADEVAGRVAAKEATAKALGSGFDHRVSWHDIEVLPSAKGSPDVVLSEGADRVARDLGVARVIVSISHAGGMAVASALALGS
jgi:holo-[acyl-carrier protein] synthase